MSVIYQHGRFDAHQAGEAAGALRLFYANRVLSGLRGAQSARECVLCARSAQDAHARELQCRGAEPAAQLVLYGAPAMGSQRELALSTACIATPRTSLILYFLMRRQLTLLETRSMLALLGKLDRLRSRPCGRSAVSVGHFPAGRLGHLQTFLGPSYAGLSANDHCRGSGLSLLVGVRPEDPRSCARSSQPSNEDCERKLWRVRQAAGQTGCRPAVRVSTLPASVLRLSSSYGVGHSPCTTGFHGSRMYPRQASSICTAMHNPQWVRYHSAASYIQPRKPTIGHAGDETRSRRRQLQLPSSSQSHTSRHCSYQY